MLKKADSAKRALEDIWTPTTSLPISWKGKGFNFDRAKSLLSKQTTLCYFETYWCGRLYEKRGA